MGRAATGDHFHPLHSLCQHAYTLPAQHVAPDRWCLARGRGCIFQPWQPGSGAFPAAALSSRQEYSKRRDPRVVACLFGPATASLVHTALGGEAYLYNEQVPACYPAMAAGHCLHTANPVLVQRVLPHESTCASYQVCHWPEAPRLAGRPVREQPWGTPAFSAGWSTPTRHVRNSSAGWLLAGCMPHASMLHPLCRHLVHAASPSPSSSAHFIHPRLHHGRRPAAARCLAGACAQNCPDARCNHSLCCHMDG
jgi:hypothetical protein